MHDQLRHSVLPSTLLCCVLSTHIFANNGHIAIAYPCHEIRLDGDFSDWPSDVVRYPITFNHYGDPPRDEDDFAAWYQVAYDPTNQRLYVAVEVQDESTVLRTPGAAERWNSRDGCGIYLGTDHGPRGCAANESNLMAGLDHPTNGRNRVVRKQADAVVRYEWEFLLADDDVDSSEPFTCVWDVEAIDLDEDGSLSIRYWSPSAWKQLEADRCGDLIVGVTPEQMGEIKGSLRTGIPAPGCILLRFQSRSNPNLTVHLLSEPDGSFQAALPEGQYTCQAVHSDGELTLLEVRAGTSSVVDLEFDWSELIPQQLGVGRTTTTGAGVPDMTALNRRLSYSIERFTSINGIPNGHMEDMTLDHKGRLWMANEQGLARLGDGQTVIFGEADGLPDKSIVSLLFEDDRRFWVGTNQGLVRLSLADNTLVTIPALRGLRIYDVARLHDGRLGVATEQGLYAVDLTDAGASVACLGLAKTRCLSLLADPSRSFTWVGTDDGVTQYAATRQTNLARAQGLPDGRIWKMFADRRGNIWFGANRSIFCFDGNDYTTVRTNEHVRFRFGGGFVEDEDGLIWVSSYGRELASDDSTVVAAYVRPSQSGVVHEAAMPVSCLCGDHAGNVWSGGTGLLTRLDRNLVQTSAARCSSVAIDKQQNVWFAGRQQRSPQGWWLRKLPRGRRVEVTNRLPAGSDVSIILPHANQPDHVWVGTEATGLLLFDGNSFSYPDIRSPSGTSDWPRHTGIVDLRYVSSGELWVAATDGLFIINQEMSVRRLGLSTGLPTNRVDSICAFSDGRIVCGTFSGVTILDPVSGELLQRITSDDGLSSNACPVVHVQSDDTLWVGTETGLYRYRDSEARLFQADNRILRCGVRRIGEDSNGQLWVLSDLGVTRIDVHRNLCQSTLHVLGPRADRHQQSLAFVNNRAWIANSNGLFRFTQGSKAPSLQLDTVYTDREHSARDAVQVTTDIGAVEFRYHAVCLNTNSESIIYRYRWKGYDNDWKTTRDNWVRFETPQTAGNYIFQVQAFDRDLHSSPVQSVNIWVTPPLGRWAMYATLALLAAACLVMTLAYLQYAWRVNRELEERVAARTAETLAAKEEKQQLREELLHAQKLESLGTMAAGVAHDFNNALCAIQTNAELGLLDCQNKSTAESLREVVAASEQAGKLTESLLTFAGKSTTVRHPTCLNQLVDSSVKMIQRTMPTNIDVATTNATDPIWCDVDENQIKQVLINLVMNARDAIIRNGVIRLGVSPADPKDPACPMAIVQISDDGQGIAAEVIPRIFEPFFTLKPRGKGTGLGLSIAQSIITAHGGSISVQSKPGEGATFQIFLPTCPAPADSTTNDLVQPGLPQPMKYLGAAIVAEDEPRVRLALAQALSQAGFDVHATENGQELVELAAELGGKVRLLVLDVDMPRMNGLTALETIRRQQPNLPAIVVTGLPTDDPLQANDSTTRLLRKPFALTALKANALEMMKDSAEGTSYSN